MCTHKHACTLHADLETPVDQILAWLCFAAEIYYFVLSTLFICLTSYCAGVFHFTDSDYKNNKLFFRHNRICIYISGQFIVIHLTALFFWSFRNLHIYSYIFFVSLFMHTYSHILQCQNITFHVIVFSIIHVLRCLRK